MATTVTNPTDVLKLQSEYVRTGKYLSLGRMQKISIGYNAKYVPPEGDRFIRMYGRFIELRDRVLPIAHSPDKSMIFVTAPLVDRSGRVELPDVPDPEWIAPTRTKEEIEGIEHINPVTGKTYWEIPKTDGARYIPPMIRQSLRDRTNEKLVGSDFLVFSPVIRITFQPELNDRLVGTAWWIDCSYNPADRTEACFLVNEQTGICHFYGGLYQISAPSGQ